MSAAALGKVVEIGLVASADISEEVLARDSDAAPSVLWPEQRWLGQLLSTEYTAPGESHSESAPSWMCYALQALCVVTALVSVPNVPGDYAEMAGMTEPNVLLYMFATMLVSAWSRQLSPSPHRSHLQLGASDTDECRRAAPILQTHARLSRTSGQIRWRSGSRRPHRR